MTVKEYVNKYKDELINDIIEVCSIKSVQEEAKEGMPFGEGPAKALQCALAIGEKYGFKAVNLDNYAGYIEMGEGEDIIGILAHVDIVPEGIDWTSDPYKPEIRDGKLYGRGVADDKGPAMISLHAMRILRDMGTKFNKRVRLVLGANEETGSACVRYYKEKEGGFQYGFSPDAEFPLIFGEKGMCPAGFAAPLNTPDAKTIVEDITGGIAGNAVCPKCTVILSGEKLEEIEQALYAYGKEVNLPVEAELKDGKLTISIIGVSAHGSTPEKGINAISHITTFLKTQIDTCPYVNAYTQCIGLTHDGSKCGVACTDEYGSTTMNVGIVSTENGIASSRLDLRYALTCDFEPYVPVLKKSFEDAGATFIGGMGVFPRLFIDPESDFIQALYSSYVKVTGDTVNKPFSIGGGTYSRSFDNVVAFGNQFPGEDNFIHMADEHMALDSIFKCVEIYVDAIQKLLAL
ncbi:MAG: dipeptidase PepV [Eubacteriaceae bacterium]|nr:dipeptidase PepV [Eubacteriaceae bacterium]